MRRIAIVSRQVSGFTGTSTTIFEHVRRLSALGWEVHVYGEKLDSSRLRQAGAQSHRLPGWPWGSYFKRRLFACLAERSVRAQGFDLVCGHGDTLRQDVLSLHNCVHAAHEAVYGTPLSPRSGVGRIHERALRERGFRLLIANSELMKRDVALRFQVPPEKIEVIYPGHDPERFNPSGRQKVRAAFRSELGVRNEEVLVGLITSGDFAKRGVDLFLEALGGLSAPAKARIKVLIVGQETRLAPYLRLAADTGISEKIVFLPPSPQVERFYHALDVYVHPALFEEFGQSVQEAMACGVCVLTSAMVGASELLRGEARNMLLPRPEPRAFASSLERLALEPLMREGWAEQCRDAARVNTWDENFRRTVACYERLLA